MDQASELRTMKERSAGKAVFPPRPGLEITSITGGKGGVGKSNIALNLAVALSERGRRVCLLDADFGLANIDVLLGLKPPFNIAQVFAGRKKLDEILMDGPGNVKLIPAASGLRHLAELSEQSLSRLAIEARELGSRFDHLIIDTPAGISRNVMTFLLASSQIVVVATPEPTSITDSYALLKSHHLEGGRARTLILMNMCRSREEGERVGQRLRQISKHFLGIFPGFLGVVRFDAQWTRAIRRQRSLLELFPCGEAADEIRRLAQKLDREETAKNDLGDFFSRIKATLQ
jgi:flagellar biosynthesis protein FlhG